MYNQILTQTTDVEQQLIKKKLEMIDADIKKGETVILWDSEGELEVNHTNYNSESSLVLNLNEITFSLALPY